MAVAKACAASRDALKVKELHNDATRCGVMSNVFVGNALIHAYGKCKCIEGARRAFDDLIVRDVVSWTSLSSCYVNCGFPQKGLNVFREMGWNGVKPNPVSVSSILPASSDLKDLKSGKAIHGFAVRHGMVEDVFVCNSLVNLYAKCLCVREAHAIFDLMPHRNVVSWNGVLTAYFTNKEYEKGLSLFSQISRDGVETDEVTWSIVIAGCIENGRIEEAMEMLWKMQNMGFKPNELTISSILQDCYLSESLRMCKEIHCYVFRHRKVWDLKCTNTLLYTYAKCGDLSFSRNVFDMIAVKDVVSWTTMINANAMHGNGKEALFLFEKMLLSMVKPNSVTFTCVLSSCSHSRLVEEGVQIFNSMSKDHLVEPNAMHYSCVVDIYSRAGRLDEAYEFIQRMPMEPTAGAWKSLLAGCTVYKNVELAKISAKKLFEIEPSRSVNYVGLFNILLTAKLWSEASKIRMLMKERGITKSPGCSWLHVGNRVHTFVAGDKSNMENAKIYNFLDELVEKIKAAGYKPDTNYVLQDINQEEKVESLCKHSEKLAVAFGILNLNGQSTIRVFKNLRICDDCCQTPSGFITSKMEIVLL